MSAIVFTNARLVDPATDRDEAGALRIADGVITDIGKPLSAQGNERVLDLKGAVLSPALIDLRCHANLESSGVQGVSTAVKAAAAGGIGTLVLAPDSGFDTPEDFKAFNTEQLTSPVRLLAAGMAVNSHTDLAEIGLILRSGAAFVGDGGQPIADTRLASRILAYASGFDAWVSLRPEDVSLSEQTVATDSDLSTRLGLPSRPAHSEAIAIARDATLTSHAGARLIIDRVSTKVGLIAADTARKNATEVAVTTPVTHLIFNEMDIGGLDARYRLDPPLRSENDREALIDALANGQIDAVVSGHSACTNQSKAHPFPEAAAGSANLEGLLAGLCTLVQEGRLSLLDALRPVTSGPADLLALDQGRLEEGAPADLLIFDPDAPVVYGRDSLHCPAPSAFDGRRLFGKPLITIVEGAIIYQLEG